MKMKLNAEIILNILPTSKQKERELTKEQKGCLVLLVEQTLNSINSVSLKSADLVIGIRVHIKNEIKTNTVEIKLEENTHFTCTWCRNIIQGKPSKCKMCNNKFCTECVNDHEHCKACSGTGICVSFGNDDDTIECLTCYGTGLEN